MCSLSISKDLPSRWALGLAPWVGVHQQVKLRIRQAELDMKIPTSSKSFHRVVVRRRRVLFREVGRKAVGSNCIEQAGLIAEDAIQDRRLHLCGFGDVACGYCISPLFR